MIAVIVENIVFPTGPCFRQFLQYFDKFLRLHFGLAQINFPIELVLSTFRLHHNDPTFIRIGRYDTVTVFLVTGCIEDSFTWFPLQYGIRPNRCMIRTCWRMWSRIRWDKFCKCAFGEDWMLDGKLLWVEKFEFKYFVELRFII